MLILPGSVEEGLIADWMEAGLGFRHTTTMVNQHRREEGLRIVGRSCVMSTFDRMNPILTNIAKCCQGNSNNEGWRTARYNQTKQMMVMTGHITKEELEKEYGIDKIPLYYHPDHLPKITPEQLVWFDETHIQQEGGEVSRSGIQIRFPRDATGAFSPKSDTNPNPKYAEPLKYQTFKYPKEGRFGLGVAAMKMPDGTVEGRRANVYDYTGKTLVSMKAWEDKISTEIKRVQKMKSERVTSPWICDGRPVDDVFWEGDSVDCIRGISTITKGKLQESEHQIKTVRELAGSDANDLPGIRGVARFIELTNGAMVGDCPHVCVDYRDSANPYKARYPDTWEEELEKSAALPPFCPITHLVEYIIEESTRIIAGTVRKDDWYFFMTRYR